MSEQQGSEFNKKRNSLALSTGKQDSHRQVLIPQCTSQWQSQSQEESEYESYRNLQTDDGRQLPLKQVLNYAEEPQSNLTFAQGRHKNSWSSQTASQLLQPVTVGCNNQISGYYYSNSNAFQNQDQQKQNNSPFVTSSIQSFKQNDNKISDYGMVSSRSGSPGINSQSIRLYGKQEVFQTIKEMQVKNGAERRRNLLNFPDEDLEGIRGRKDSTVDNTQIEDFKHGGKVEYSADSLFKRHQRENYEKSDSFPPSKGCEDSHLAEKSGDCQLPSKLDSSMIQIQHQNQDAKATSSIQVSSEQMNQFKQMKSISLLKDDKFKSRNSLFDESKGRLISSEIMKNQKKSFSKNCTLSCKILRQDSQISDGSQVASMGVIQNDPNHKSIDQLPPIKYTTLIFIKRFINRLKKQVQSSMFRNLHVNQIKLINDLSHEDEGVLVNESQINRLKKSESNKKQAKRRLKKLKGSSFLYDTYFKQIVISSQSMFSMLFEVVLLLTLFLHTYLIPLKICFDDEKNNYFDTITTSTFPIFLIEIILSFITSYYLEGLEVRKQKKIIKHYIKEKFFGDIITFISLFISYQIKKEWFSIIFLGRVSRIPKLLNSINDHFQLGHKFPTTFELLKLILLIATIGHYCGCGFNYLGRLEKNNGEYSWLAYKNIDNSSWDVQYLYGLYFSFITMITVGYGDITPQTSKEIIYVMCMTLLSTGTFAYSINTIGSIFREMQVRKSELKQEAILFLQVYHLYFTQKAEV